MSIEQKIAFVTGASRGIGQAIALALAKQNFFVVGTATTQEGADSITQMFQTNNVKGKGRVLNVTDRSAIEALYQAINQEFGPVQILVNNAGITRDNLMLRMKEGEWEDVIQTNLNSLFYLTKLCIKDMLKAKWGRIINISSVLGSTGNAGQVNYCTAKAGILGFTKALAQEVASRSITVNAISPGFIESHMTQQLSEQQRATILERVPMKRVGTPEDVASSVVFLVSEGASYITGHTLHINGGFYMA